MNVRATALFLSVAALVACKDNPPSSGAFDVDAGDAGLTDVPADVWSDADASVDATPDVSDATDAGDTADAADAEPDLIILPPVVVAVETRLSSYSVAAGESVFVSCDAIDEDGELVALGPDVTESWIVAPDDSLIPGLSDDELIATRAGNASISCVIPSLSLVDATPADLAIDAGPPYTVVTQADSLTVPAGVPVDVTCTAYDAYGNYVPDAEFGLLVDPFGDGVEIYPSRAVITNAGLHTLTCTSGSAPVLIGELIEVGPGLPAELVVGVDPDRALYTVGDVVSLVFTVTDAYGNLIPNPPVNFSSFPAVPSFGDGRFRFDSEGLYRLTVTIGLPTATGSPLVGWVELTVNETGPTIECDAPYYGEMIHGSPGDLVLVEGRTNDEFGVASVTVNGVDAHIRPDGSFILDVPGEFGINFLDIEAADELGATSRRTCAFLMADQWNEEQTFLDNDIALTLTQDAFDDRDPRDGLDSINDLIWTLLNAPEVVSQIDATLNEANPIYPRTCVLDTFLGCLVRVGVDYRYFRLDGPNDSSLTLVEDGMRISADLRDMEIGLRITGTFGTSGDISLSRLGLTMTFNVDLAGGRPRVSIRRLDRVDIGSIDSDFSGITGFVLDIIVDIFEDTIRDLIRDAVQDFIEGEINDLLDGVLSGLDINSLGSVIEVPRLDGGDPIEVGFGIRFSMLDFTPLRGMFGIGTRFTAPIEHAGTTLGAAIPPGAVIDDRPAERSVRASLNLGLMNQLLHTLWRAGMFDASIGSETLGDDLPSDLTAELYSNLPPVVVGRSGGDLELHFGGMRAEIDYAGILLEPIVVHLGAKVSTGVDLVGDDELDFRDITLTDFYFDPLDAGLDAGTQETLEIFMEDLIEYVLDSALNSALPNFPIPSFEIPADLAAFGLPGGAYLGILSPILEIDDRYLILQGNFGTR